MRISVQASRVRKCMWSYRSSELMAVGRMAPRRYSTGWEYSEARETVVVNSWCRLWMCG